MARIARVAPITALLASCAPTGRQRADSQVERRGDGATAFSASEFVPCAGINPGWSVRVQCMY